MSGKDEFLKIYDLDMSYQSINRLCKEAKEMDEDIALAYVKGWYNHFNDRTTQLHGFNSYIAPSPNWEYQIDLFFLPELDTPNIGLACIDIYTNYATIVPLQSKKPLDVSTYAS